MSTMFANCIHESPNMRKPEIEMEVFEINQGDDVRDSALQNLEGAGAQAAAERWAENAKIRKMLEFLHKYLPAREQAFVDRVLGTPLPSFSVPTQPRSTARKPPESDEETDGEDDDDEHARTAHKLFAESVDIHGKGREIGVWFGESQSPALKSPTILPATQHQSPSIERSHLLTPVTSPAMRMPRRKRNRDSTNQGLKDLTMVAEKLVSPVRLSSPNSDTHFLSPVAQSQTSKTGSYTEPLVDVHNYRAMNYSPDAKRRKISKDPIANTAKPIPQVEVRLPPSSFLQPVTHIPLRRDSEHRAVVANGRSSPSRFRKRALKAERKTIAQKLLRARPDLSATSASHGHNEKICHAGNTAVANSSSNPKALIDALPSFPLASIPRSSEMDWERSHALAEQVRCAISRGHNPAMVLPPLKCIESQVDVETHSI